MPIGKNSSLPKYVRRCTPCEVTLLPPFALYLSLFFPVPLGVAITRKPGVEEPNVEMARCPVGDELAAEAVRVAGLSSMLPRLRTLTVELAECMIKSGTLKSCFRWE